MVSWLKQRKGWRHLDDRITDLGWVYLVNAQPDAVFDGVAGLDRGAGPILVVKRNGGVWELPWSPDLVPAIGAPDEQAFGRLMWDAGRPVNLDQASEWVGPQQPADQTALVGIEQVTTWVRNTTSWRHVEDRIADLGWAFTVSTQPDEYHDGNEFAVTYGNGPMVVVKRTGAMWQLASTPDMISALQAPSEKDFYEVLRASLPGLDEERPTGWLNW